MQLEKSKFSKIVGIVNKRDSHGLTSRIHKLQKKRIDRLKSIGVVRFVGR